RIEVGYGLEGVLTDAMSNRIISETIAPAFREGNFYGGIEGGLEQMMKRIDGESLPPPEHEGHRGPGHAGGGGRRVPAAAGPRRCSACWSARWCCVGSSAARSARPSPVAVPERSSTWLAMRSRSPGWPPWPPSSSHW